jgi:hypothetical protein
MLRGLSDFNGASRANRMRLSRAFDDPALRDRACDLTRTGVRLNGGSGPWLEKARLSRLVRRANA